MLVVILFIRLIFVVKIEGNIKEEKVSEFYDFYDIYCKVLDEVDVENYFVDEIFLDDVWFCNEVLDSFGN